MIAKQHAEGVERLHLVQLLRRYMSLAERRHAKVHEGPQGRVPAEATAGLHRVDDGVRTANLRSGFHMTWPFPGHGDEVLD